MQQPANCLRVFDNFVGLALKGLSSINQSDYLKFIIVVISIAPNPQDKVFKNGPSKICGKQHLKNLINQFLKFSFNPLYKGSFPSLAFNIKLI